MSLYQTIQKSLRISGSLKHGLDLDYKNEEARRKQPGIAMTPRRHPRMFLSGVQFRTRLDSRLRHAGMTDFG